jgi:large subunit ribosomal protein L5
LQALQAGDGRDMSGPPKSQTRPKAAATAAPAPRMMERYRKEIAPALSNTFKHGNPMAVPRFEKIVINIGCGEAAHDAKILEAAQRTLGAISGQKPVITRAKKAVSNFHIRENDPVGCKVTLRRARMYEFLDRLISVALPRIRDFRGFSPKGFDEAGNYSFGLAEHGIFPEVQLDQTPYTLGMDIVFVTNAGNRDQALALLKAFGFPFSGQEHAKEQH